MDRSTTKRQLGRHVGPVRLVEGVPVKRISSLRNI